MNNHVSMCINGCPCLYSCVCVKMGIPKLVYSFMSLLHMYLCDLSLYEYLRTHVFTYLLTYSCSCAYVRGGEVLLPMCSWVFVNVAFFKKLYVGIGALMSLCVYVFICICMYFFGYVNNWVDVYAEIFEFFDMRWFVLVYVCINKWVREIEWGVKASIRKKREIL